MSFKLMVNVIKECKRKPSEKLMLIILANFANEKAECFPSLQTLAELCNISTRQAQNILYALAEAGEITICHRQGRVNVYRLSNYNHEIKNGAKSPKSTPQPPRQTAPTHEISSGNKQGSHSTTDETHFVGTDQIGDTSPTKPISPPPRNTFHDSHEVDFVTPTKPTSHDPVIYSTTEPAIKPTINYVVSPNGIDTTPTSRVDESTPPTPDLSTPDLPIGASNTHPPTNEGEKQPTAPPTTSYRPKAKPPAARKTPRPLSDHQRMVSAILAVFGWDMTKLTPSNRSLVGKVARDLLQAGGTPEDIPALYQFCKSQNWSGAFTPAALSSQWANYYALKRKRQITPDVIENDAGMVFHRYIPDPNRKPPVICTDATDNTAGDVHRADDPSHDAGETDTTSQTSADHTAALEQIISQIVSKMVIEDVDLDAIPEDEELRELLW